MWNQGFPRLLLAAVLLLPLLCSPGCGKKPEAKPSSMAEKKTDAPRSVREMFKTIDEIIAELDKKVKTEKLPRMSRNAPAGGQQGQGGKAAQGAGGGGQQGQSAQQKNQPGSSSDQGGKQDWQKETKALKKLHQDWNALEPEADKVGLGVETRDDFEKGLAALTAAIGMERAEDSLPAAIEVYRKFAGVVQVFSLRVPYNYYLVKADVMAAVADAYRQDWTMAAGYLGNLRTPWSNLCLQAKKAGKELIDQTDYSILDLEDAVNLQDMNLVSIKGEIVLSNLKRMEGKISSQSSSGEGGRRGTQ